MPNKVKALLFDVFGTVVDWRSSIDREMAAYFTGRQIERDWGAFADAWRRRYQPAMEEVRNGNRPFIKLDELHRENLIDTLGEFGLKDLSDEAIDHLNRAWHRLDPWPDTVEGLQRLKQHYILGSLSNGNVALIVNMAKNAGLPWDVILGAEVARAYKPQPEAYLRAAELLSLDPDACMMVAAHNSDLLAARGCGLKTAFVLRPMEHGAGQNSDLAPLENFDLTARNFTDLADQLGC